MELPRGLSVETPSSYSQEARILQAGRVHNDFKFKLPGHISPLAVEFAHTLFQFQRIKPTREAFNGLRRSEFLFLATLARNIQPEARGMRASELSSLLEITPGAVTHILNILERNGDVERVSDPSDRRVVLIRPTGQGLQILNQANLQLMESLTGLVNYLGETNSREFIRLCSLSLNYFRPEENQDQSRS